MTHGDTSDSAAVAARELVVSETFVMLADSLVDDYDVIDVLDRLVQACVSLFPVTAAGLLLDDQRGGLELVASSSEESRLLELFQLQTNEGPCLDCVHAGAQLLSTDLRNDEARWPLFVPAAISAGFLSVAAIPLRLRAEIIGGLNLFSDRPLQLPKRDQRLAQAMADVATISILQQRSVHRSSVLVEQLQAALHSRVVIEQAKGVIAERAGVDMDTAFRSIRRFARDTNAKIGDVARAVVLGEVDASQLLG